MNLINQCQQSYISCSCYIILLIYAGIVMIIAGNAIYRLKKAQANFQELSPMFFCVLQSLLHIIQYVISENNKLQIFTLYVQILTFTCIQTLFATLCYQIKSNGLPFKNYGTFKQYQFVIYGIFFIFQLLSLVYSQSFQCDKFYYGGVILILIQQTISTGLTLFFGRMLLSKLNRVAKFIQFKTMNPHAIYDSYAKISVVTQKSSLIEPRQLSEKKKQINTVLNLMTMTTTLYILFAIFVNLYESRITCNHTLDVYQYQDIILLIYGIIQMTPCLVIPYVFGFVPQFELQALEYSSDSIILDRTISETLIM